MRIANDMNKIYLLLLLLILILLYNIFIQDINIPKNISKHINIPIIKDFSPTQETFSNFIPSSDSNYLSHSLSNIFKNSDLNTKEYPNVEIKPGNLLFNHNKFLPECCFYYSQYSSDKGCPCITPEQQYYLSRRGLNRTSDAFQKEKGYINKFFSPTMAFKNKDVFKEHNTNYVKSNKFSNVTDKQKQAFLSKTDLDKYKIPTQNKNVYNPSIID